MRSIQTYLFLLPCLFTLVGCGYQLQNTNEDGSVKVDSKPQTILEGARKGQSEIEQIYNISACRYQIPESNWNNLSIDNKKFAYFLTQAGLAGRDLYSNQLYQHNLEILELLSFVHENYTGDRSSEEWQFFDEYTKRAWLKDGVYGNFSKKIIRPYFSKDWFTNQLRLRNYKMRSEIEVALFPENNIYTSTPTNFYDSDITIKEAKEFYANYEPLTNEHDSLEFGLNSKLIRNQSGALIERRYSSQALGAECINQMIFWLDKAKEVAETPEQKISINSLIDYYQSGDLADWEKYNLDWLNVQGNSIDFINGFVEKYEDPLSRKGSYESLVYVIDEEHSKKMKDLSDRALWFEQNAPILEKHKKTNAIASHAQVVNVVNGVGSITPGMYTEIGLPNSEWIRNNIGSKNLICKNILGAQNSLEARGILTEFAHDEEEVIRQFAYGGESLVVYSALKMLGYSFGKTEEGVASPFITLGENSNTINYLISNTFSLYYALDTRLVDFGFISSEEVGKTLVDHFLRSNYLVRIGNLELGKTSQSSQFISFQTITNWLLEKGAGRCIDIVEREGKTYINVTDYNQLQELLGELLAIAVAIESTGDYEGAEKLSAYGKTVNEDLKIQIHERKKVLDLPSSSLFIQPMLTPIHDDQGEIMDIKISYDTPLEEQMKYFKEEFGL